MRVAGGTGAKGTKLIESNKGWGDGRGADGLVIPCIYRILCIRNDDGDDESNEMKWVGCERCDCINVYRSNAI